MNWWQDPAQRREIRIGEIIEEGDLWVNPNGDITPPSMFIGVPLEKNGVPLYRRIYPKDNAELISLRMEVMDLSDQVASLTAELNEARAILSWAGLFTGTYQSR